MTATKSGGSWQFWGRALVVPYLLLFAVWVYVLHTKISHGPDDGEGDHGEGPPSLLDAAAERADPASPASLTEARRGEVAP